LVAFVGCRQDMHDQAKNQPFEASDFFSDGKAGRSLVEGTIARGYLQEDAYLYTGKIKGEPVDAFPFEVDLDALKRGRERYDIFCSPCHDRAGMGLGMVVQRGFKQPPTFHSDRLRAVKPGYLFDVITNGFGSMTSYRARIPTQDRWLIAAYIQTLQFSAYAPVGELSGRDKEALRSGK